MKIAIAGCAGRMGRMIGAEAARMEGCTLVAGTEPDGSPALGKDMGELAGIGANGVRIAADPKALFQTADVVIDFTAPAATMRHVELAGARATALVIGTTGLDGKQVDTLRAAGKRSTIVHASNMSAGVNLLLGLTRQVAQILGPDYDIEIVEMHHRHKVDAPSGTALALGEAAAQGRGVKLQEVAVKVRDGVTGARARGTIGFATLRGGDVVGDHTVIFATDGERIELTHKTSTRATFAKGAVRAALWCKGRPPGYYTMRDVLGLDSK